jgi:DNA replication licensing factor MCM6
LADAIQSDMVRFERYLRQAIHQFVYHVQPLLNQQNNINNNNNNKGNTYFVALHNLPMILPLRKLRTHQIGQLCSIAGTVTRTSQVRPELLVGSFRCQKCGLLAQDVVQHYHYTRPALCRNPRCQNKSPTQFILDLLHCEFCDWQKLRVQENPHEIPPGSMPRSMDVIVRNEMVERAKAGDACVFTGSWVVIPDGSALARAGEAAQSSRNPKMSSGRDPLAAASGGVRGLQACGVRELTYRTCFVATTVLHVGDNSHAAHDHHNYHEPSTDEIISQFSEAEIEEIRSMKSMSNLYELVSV